jgi:hypothetical protein
VPGSGEPLPLAQLSPDIQETPCRQALKQIPEGTLRTQAFRGQRRDW